MTNGTSLNGYNSSVYTHYQDDHGSPSGASSSTQNSRGRPAQYDERFPPARRDSRTSSMPPQDLDQFYPTLRSVGQHGVMSQHEMQQRGNGYYPSNDGLNSRQDIDVTRLPGGQRLQDANRIARGAVQYPSHGALSVALERGGLGPLPTEARTPSHQEIFNSFTREEHAEFQELAKEVGPEYAIAMIASNRQIRGLSDAGRMQAEQRMHHSFMVTAPSSQRATHLDAYEDTRSHIHPTQFTSVQVPAQHMHTARQVRTDLAPRGPVLPIRGVGSVPGMAPYYQQPAGDRMQVTGGHAPAYHHEIERQSYLHPEGVDVHLVKTDIPEDDPYPYGRSWRSGSY
jgi:hypothetical protein